jgi:hypothetical protein
MTSNSPIDDFILHSFLRKLCKAKQDIKFLDSNFNQHLIHHGWESAFLKYFLHDSSKAYSKKARQKPKLQTPIILIPIHIHGSHWVALSRCIINNEIYFFYVDNLNSPST